MDKYIHIFKVGILLMITSISPTPKDKTQSKDVRHKIRAGFTSKCLPGHREKCRPILTI